MSSRVLRVLLGRLVAYAIALLVFSGAGVLVGAAVVRVRDDEESLAGLFFPIFGGYGGFALGVIVLIAIEVAVARDRRRRRVSPWAGGDAG